MQLRTNSCIYQSTYQLIPSYELRASLMYTFMNTDNEPVLDIQEMNGYAYQFL